MKGWDLAACSVTAINFSHNNKITQREKADVTEVIKWKWILITELKRGPQLLLATVLSPGEGAFHPSAYHVGLGKEGERRKMCIMIFSCREQRAWPCGDWGSWNALGFTFSSLCSFSQAPTFCLWGKVPHRHPLNQITKALRVLSGFQFSSRSSYHPQMHKCAWATSNGGGGESICTVKLVSGAGSNGGEHDTWSRQPRKTPWYLMAHTPQQDLRKDGFCL